MNIQIASEPRPGAWLSRYQFPGIAAGGVNNGLEGIDGTGGAFGIGIVPGTGGSVLALCF